MYTSVKTRKKRRHVGPACLKLPGENTVAVLIGDFVCISVFSLMKCSFVKAFGSEACQCSGWGADRECLSGKVICI